MTFLKRIATLLLSVTMLVSGFAVYAQETEVSDETSSLLNSEEFDVLYTMGMLGEDFLTLRENEPVTRAQFLGSLFNIAGFSMLQYKIEEMPFIDVSVESPYRDAIFTLYKMNLVNGTSKETFSPDETINYVQAVKFILNVCGYGEFTQLKYGNDMNAYLAMAQYLDLSRGIKIGDKDAPLESWKAVKLLYNAARTKVMEPAAFSGKDMVYYEVAGSKELISVHNDIYYNEGIMTSNGVISLYSSEVDEKYATIGNTDYLVGNLDLTKMLGCSVKYFYKIENGFKTLKWVGSVDKNNILEVDSYELKVDDYRYTMQRIVYTRNGSLNFVNISPYATIIYNNSLYNDAGVDKLKPQMGSIKFIDSNNDNVYDVVIVEEYENIFTTSVISSMSLIGSKYTPAVDLSEYEYVKIYKNGKECEKEDIKINSIISVVRDRNKKFIFLYLSDEKVQGRIMSTYNEKGISFYEIEDQTYQLSKGYENRDSSKYAKITPELGKAYTFYIDKDGKIAEITDAIIDSGCLDYAYIIDIYPDDAFRSAENAAIVELLLKDGSVVEAETKKRLTLNNVKNKNGMDIYNTTGLWKDGIVGGTVDQQVVRVSFDSEGLLKEFETAVNNLGNPYGYDPENFSLDFTESASVGTRNGILSFNKYTLDDSITVFVKYSDSEFGDSYGTISGKSIPTGTRALRLYDINAAQRISVATLVLGQGSSLGQEFLVSDVFHKKVDGEFVKFLGGYYGGAYLEYAELEEGRIPADIKRGDVVDITLYNQRIFSVKKFLSLADRPDPIGTGTYLSSYRMFSHVYTASNVGITMIGPSGFASNYGKILPVAFNKAYIIPVTIYDVENDKMYRGSVSDLTATTHPDKYGDLVIDDNTVMAVVQVSSNQLKDVIYVKY